MYKIIRERAKLQLCLASASVYALLWALCIAMYSNLEFFYTASGIETIIRIFNAKIIHFEKIMDKSYLKMLVLHFYLSPKAAFDKCFIYNKVEDF